MVLHDLVRLSDLLRLCASTMRSLAGDELAVGARAEAHTLAAELDQIATKARELAPALAKSDRRLS